MRLLRNLLFVMGFCSAAWIVFTLLDRALDRAGIEPLVTRHEVASYYRDKVDYVTSRVPHGGRYRVVYLGDSMVVSYPENRDVPSMLQKEVWRRGRGKTSVQVLNFALAGTGIFDYYLMADEIAEVEPDMVIIGFNLASHSQRFRSAFARPELAGWIEAERIPESALLPLSWIGLTFDRLFFYRSIILLGGFPDWLRITQEQTRVTQARTLLEDHLAFRNARNVSPEDRQKASRAFWSLKFNNDNSTPNRYTAAAMREHFGPVLDGLRSSDPSVAMLAATVRDLSERGIQPFVYVNPINMEHLERLGLRDTEAIGRSLALIEDAVTSNGGLYLDLHDIFPDAAFRDQPGHFAYEGEIDGPRQLAAKLAPTVMKTARRSRR